MCWRLLISWVSECGCGGSIKFSGGLPDDCLNWLSGIAEGMHPWVALTRLPWESIRFLSWATTAVPISGGIRSWMWSSTCWRRRGSRLLDVAWTLSVDSALVDTGTRPGELEGCQERKIERFQSFHCAVVTMHTAWTRVTTTNTPFLNWLASTFTFICFLLYQSLNVNFS